ncbi:MFS transporter [Amorphus orientalis]|uniref:MHS family proline/betaine transporter-like MFS transporter n=1 Tax=Amorphus orientalis TaxID=649198 RepID=A0AAE3VQN1_9HYPH|nr:MFS transporter [Amorphus orientalis]MDQ0316549.1 MHS family proline/betaine transporter-like MFS transporter [Amorphus orientalis]
MSSSLFAHWSRKTVAGAIGNTLEWYDYAIYGYFATIIAKQFFPSGDPTAALIATFGVFAAGFLMRPFGGLVIGHIADKLGRKLALTLSVAMMAIPTTLIAFLPTYEQIGLAAPLLLTFLRLVQGLSVGGEYTGSVTYLVENGPQDRRGLSGSFGLVGANAGILLGSAAGAIVTAVVPDTDVGSWGWRVPFLFGLVLGVAGIYFRSHLEEAEVEWSDPHEGAELDEKGEPEFPIVDAVRHHWRSMLHVVGVNVLNGVGFYIAFVYLTTFIVDFDDVKEGTALDINTIVIAFLIVLVPFFGALSDRFGRKPVMLAGAAGMILFSYPLFVLLASKSFGLILLGQLGFAVLMGCFTGPLPTTMTEQFPRHVRVTAYSVAFNIPLALFGGTAPMVVTYLISLSGTHMAPAFYAMAAAVIAFATLLTMRESKDRPLPR